MRVLLTGHDGYIGHVLTPMLLDHGHEVTGVDSLLFKDCGFPSLRPAIRVIPKDVRDLQLDDLRGYDVVLHLAGISNDPLGDLAPQTTYAVNHEASVRLASLAKRAGVRRFVYAASCGSYRAAGDDALDERATLDPVTPYAESKVWVEKDLARLTDENFSPASLRIATAYGYSARLRGDLIVNNLVGHAYTTGDVLLESGGMQWRPLVHIEDVARAFVAVAEAPRELVHNECFNVGQTNENFRLREITDLIVTIVPNARVTRTGSARSDARSYRLNCDKIRKRLPAFQPRWTLRRGIEQVYDGVVRHRLTAEDFLGGRFMRVQHIRALQKRGELDDALAWRRGQDRAA